MYPPRDLVTIRAWWRRAKLLRRARRFGELREDYEINRWLDAIRVM